MVAVPQVHYPTGCTRDVAQLTMSQIAQPASYVHVLAVHIGKPYTRTGPTEPAVDTGRSDD
jgi:hypothetical protein